jgi:hypothetical protein
MLTYGAVLFVVPGIAAICFARRWRLAAIATVAALIVLALSAAAGFWWFDGLAEVRRQYDIGVARFRPYEYFLLANLVVLAVAVGPATVAALARRLPAGIDLLVYATLAGVVIADVSGLSKAEVERIWLPFVPWLAAATCALPPTQRRTWLAAQLATGLVLELWLRSPW